MMIFNKKKYIVKSGFSLLELLIAISILSVILISAFNLFLATSQIRARSNAIYAVNENARVVLGKVRDSILDASSASVSGTCPANTLTLTQGASTIVYQITSGVVQRTEDANPAAAISASSVVATSGSCLFTVIANPAPAKPTVQINLRLTYNSPGNPLTEISQDYLLTVSLR